MTRALLLFFVMSISSGCHFPSYLPTANEINASTHGSYIMVNHKNKGKVKGELISVDSHEMIVLRENDMKCIELPLTGIRGFKLVYAEPRHYGWTIPLYTLATIAHGAFAVFTMPLNLIFTVALTTGAENAFTYKKDDITFEQLKMFSRFPQGIPPGIGLSEIK